MGAVIQARFGRNPDDVLLTKKQFASRLGRSIRFVETRVAEGMPSDVDRRGRRVFRPSEADPWLARYESERGQQGPKSSGQEKSNSSRLDELEGRVKQLEATIARRSPVEADEPPPNAA